MHPGKMEAIHQRFSEHTLALFTKHGIRTVDFWEDADGANKIYYILEHKDKQARDLSFEAFMIDPEWNRVKTESEKEGPIVEKIESYLMNRVPYYPASQE